MVQLDLSRLSRRLGYEFKDIKLLKLALTHCSADNDNNQRLEFLGDAILSFVIAHALYQRFPTETEGKLSRMRAFLVKGESLADIAITLSLGDYLLLGQGELRSGGHRRASILADTLEAIIAAVYLDGGIDASQQLVLRLFEAQLTENNIEDSFKDPKSILQEWLQARKQPLPMYHLIKAEGDEHQQVFHVACVISGFQISFEASGTSRRKAEQEAAKQWLDYFDKQ